MADKSKIEWTEATWNPVTGCSKVSQGCKNCYAERDWERLAAPRDKANIYTGRAFTDVQCHEDRLNQPLRWKKPRRIFVNSMSDLFHEAVPMEFIAAVFLRMASCHHHTFQVLTKRPERMKQAALAWLQLCSEMPPNIWLGVSVEDQETADERIPMLLQMPAAVRWLSVEPLLGPLMLDTYLGKLPEDNDGAPYPGHIAWVVVGGESGPKARPMHPDWVRTIRDQCRAAAVPFFFKQWGEWLPIYDRDKNDPHWHNCASVKVSTPTGQWLNLAGGQGFHGDRVVRVDRVGKKTAGRLLDGRTWDEYPT